MKDAISIFVFIIIFTSRGFSQILLFPIKVCKNKHVKYTGKTWTKKKYLQKHGLSYDMGDTESVKSPDGKIVTTYYFTTKEIPEEYIETTIWDLNSINFRNE